MSLSDINSPLKLSKLFIVVSLVSCLISACQNSEPQPNPTMVTNAQAQAPELTKPTSDSKELLKQITAPKKTDHLREGESFNVYLPQKNQAQLKIEAKLGFKVNENFPHRAVFKVGGKVVEGDVVKEKHRLTFSSTKDDISKLGTTVELSFSVCNDQMCKLYNENYQW